METTPAPTTVPAAAPERRLDVTALQCPGPVVRVRQELDAMQVGEDVAIRGTPSFKNDLEAWCASMGHTLLGMTAGGTCFEATVRKGAPQSAACTLASGAVQGVPNTATIVVFSNDLDKVMAAFIIATGLASLGTKVSMFFTFWGLSVLRKDPAPHVVKDILSAMFGFMLPRGAAKLALSKMHMLGVGTAMMKHVMATKKVSTLPELMRQARSLGVKFVACDMAMDVMGMQREELVDEVDELAGVGKFAAMTRESGTTLFI